MFLYLQNYAGAIKNWTEKAWTTGILSKLSKGSQCRVAHLLANLGWVDFDLGSSPGWWPATFLPKQVGGTSQIKVNPTQVRQEMGHPVVSNHHSHPVWALQSALNKANHATVASLLGEGVLDAALRHHHRVLGRPTPAPTPGRPGGGGGCRRCGTPVGTKVARWQSLIPSFP